MADAIPPPAANLPLAPAPVPTKDSIDPDAAPMNDKAPDSSRSMKNEESKAADAMSRLDGEGVSSRSEQASASASGQASKSGQATATTTTTAAGKPKSNFDPAALSDAIKTLDLQGAGSDSSVKREAGEEGGTKTGGADAKTEKKRERTKVQIEAAQNRDEKSKEEARVKAVKVDAPHVALLVDQLDVSKVKATELLKKNDADPLKAITAWVTSAA